MRKNRRVLRVKVDAQFAGVGTRFVQAVEFLEGKVARRELKKSTTGKF